MSSAKSLLVFVFCWGLQAQSASEDADSASMEPVAPVSVVAASHDERILGVLPNYLVVSDPNLPSQPLSAKQKFQLFLRETTDPFTLVSAGISAGVSQASNNMPRYGVGAGPYGQRMGAAYTDIAMQNFFSDAVFASIFHQDPRYYRMGPGHSVARRTAYSLSRLFVTRQDDGRAAFNISGVLGTGVGIGLSNAYYPSCNVNGPTAGSRFAGSLVSASIGNLLPEFWPEVKRKFAARHRHSN